MPFRNCSPNSGPTISDIRGQMNAQSQQIAAIEDKLSKLSPWRISAQMGERFGLYGTVLTKWEQRHGQPRESSRDHRSSRRALDSTVIKDAGKGTRFGVYQADINLDGSITNCITGHMRLSAPLLRWCCQPPLPMAQP